MFRIIYPALRWVGGLLVLLYIVAALAVLGVRYVLLPKIEHYKPDIEAQLSGVLNGRVQLGKIKASWYRLNPHIEIQQFVLHDSQGEPVLSVPHVEAVLSWRTLFRLTPQFVSLSAADIDLSVRRDTRGQLWMLGRAVSSRQGDDTSVQAGAMSDQAVRWLVTQPRIQLHDSTIRWIDESRDGTPLELHDVTFNILNRGWRHQFSLTAQPAAHVGGRFEMRGNFARLDMERPLALESGRGQLYVHIEDMQPPAWTAWVDWPPYVRSDRVDVQAWLQVAQGRPTDITADVRVHNAHLPGTGEHEAHGAHGRVYVSGNWQAFDELVLGHDGSGDKQSVDFSVELHGLDVSMSKLYDTPLQIATLGVQGSVQAGQGGIAKVDMGHLVLENNDIALAGRASWQAMEFSRLGKLDAQLEISRAELHAVHRYMPAVVDPDVREWLEQGLRAGQVYDAHMTVRGDLEQFPFDRTDVQGELRVHGEFRDTVIDYVPDEPASPGWPRLDDVSGEISIDRASLRILADRATIFAGTDKAVALRDIDALIANLRDAPVLEVSGDTSGDGASYMAFLQGSPLNGLLQHAFDDTEARGRWQLPLMLRIPLTRSIDTQVRGTIRIADGYLKIEPGMPAFEHLNGDIEFTERNVALKGLTASFLGEAVQLSGGAGPEHEALVMTGRIQADALRALIDEPGMARLSGATTYRASLSGVGGEEPQQPVLSITTDLQGMSMDFPEPINKPADAQWPLRIMWAYRANDGRVLDVTLNDSMHARFVRTGGSGNRYFDSGSIVVGRSAQWDEPGVGVDIEHPVFDGDAWDRVVKEFSSKSGAGTSTEVFPRVRFMRVQTEQGRLLGMPLEHLTYTIRQVGHAEWRADISSTETAGTLTWTEENNVIQGPLHAVFHRLAFGDKSSENATSKREGDSATSLQSGERFDDDLKIPAINLIIENLRLYGRDVGKLALVGVNEDRGDTWRLEQVTLSSTSAHLEGNGVWRLRGDQRGLSLTAEVDVSDLGDYVDQIGFKDVLSAGAGTVSLEIEWHDLPWTFDVNNIDGEVAFEFEKGRLSTLNSKSARLLEALSLQSVRRLARLELNPLALTKEGFPYDLLRGKFRLEHGRIHTEDYRVVGPAGTIVLDGLVLLTTGELDLQAVVIPNIDVSGAAIAAGVAINPVVGIGAFLAQWILKTPLAAAMTVQYKIDGDWEDPDVQAVERIKGEVEGHAD